MKKLYGTLKITLWCFIGVFIGSSISRCQGSITLVLLSGSGVPFPSLEYKTLAKSLAETYQVIEIEKLGYGRSDLAENNRYIDVVVQEHRSVLQKMGINSPVVLVAHSMGFLEALRWGQQYPFEIAGILGIDPATPGCYRKFNVEEATKKLKEMSTDTFSRKETASALVEQLVKEQDISDVEKDDPYLQVPMLFFLSNPSLSDRKIRIY